MSQCRAREPASVGSWLTFIILVAISGRDVIYGMVITMRLGAFVLSADFGLRPSLSSVMSTQHFVLDVQSCDRRWLFCEKYHPLCGFARVSWDFWQILYFWMERDDVAGGAGIYGLLLAWAHAINILRGSVCFQVKVSPTWKAYFG